MAHFTLIKTIRNKEIIRCYHINLHLYIFKKLVFNI